jgi:putative phosphoesterase
VLEPLRSAIGLLIDRGAERLIHCGDLGDLRSLDELASCGVPAHFVWGNVDSPTPQNERYVREVGLVVPSVPLRLDLSGRSAVVCHGHEREFATLDLTQGTNYLFHGHTHEVRDERQDGVRIINPGALHRARTRTCALLDSEKDALEIIKVAR